MTDSRTWLKGLGYAAFSGAVGVLMSMNLDPDHFNSDNLKHLALAAAIGALTGVAGYLKQSPLVIPVESEKAGK